MQEPLRRGNLYGENRCDKNFRNSMSLEVVKRMERGFEIGVIHKLKEEGKSSREGWEARSRSEEMIWRECKIAWSPVGAEFQYWRE